MDTYDTTLAPRFRATLLERALQLRELLGHDADAVREGAELASDFKEAAEQEAASDVQQAQSAHAAAELEQVRAALRRIADGSYGTCMDCGAAIDLRRLAALPTAAYCLDCEELHERAGRKA